MMKKIYKEMLGKRQLTEELLLACLVTCEGIISDNAKWEKVYEYRQPARALTYETERLEWSNCRKKLREALQRRYEMKKIIALTKTQTAAVPKTTVKAVVELIDSGDFTLI